jgi:hypothetical protein
MLAPFVQDLLIACTLMLLVGWVGDVMGRWIGVAGHARSAATSANIDSRRRLSGNAFTVCGSCGSSGDWVFNIDHSERARS